jgi:hypothetical protein
MNDETRNKSSAMSSAPAKDVSATHRLGIGYSGIPSSFGFRHSSFPTSGVSLKNITGAELMSQLFTNTEFNLP